MEGISSESLSAVFAVLERVANGQIAFDEMCEELDIHVASLRKNYPALHGLLNGMRTSPFTADELRNGITVSSVLPSPEVVPVIPKVTYQEWAKSGARTAKKGDKFAITWDVEAPMPQATNNFTLRQEDQNRRARFRVEKHLFENEFLAELVAELPLQQ